MEKNMEDSLFFDLYCSSLCTEVEKYSQRIGPFKEAKEWSIKFYNTSQHRIKNKSTNSNIKISNTLFTMK